MSEIKEKLLEDVYAAWRRHDIDGLVSHFTEDCVYEDLAMGATNNGRDGLRQFAEEVLKTMPDFRVEYTRRFATEEFGAGQWVITATWNGDFEGVDCTGKPVKFTGLSYYEFEGDKISKGMDCWDFTVMMKQFGVLRDDLRLLK
ncbi:ester cyclase [Kineobactrum salinum]|uniref:Ester cyclase n=1 Tax=Kineobactrum salinum TaxID=2708301 RepID=A0A6C0U584_9GAMM|nr:ester cyclase [Kineobactrum salinum]QIB67322.1 ester cyclase [Kineobactrum salinum]